MSVGLRVIDPGPIPYADLPLAGDEDLERQLDARYGGGHHLFFFRRIEIPLEALAPRLIGDIEDYLDLEDGQRRRAIAAAYRDAYLTGADDPAPAVVVCEDGWDLLDGHHRAAGARAAGRLSIEAFDLLPE